MSEPTFRNEEDVIDEIDEVETRVSPKRMFGDKGDNGGTAAQQLETEGPVDTVSPVTYC